MSLKKIKYLRIVVVIIPVILFSLIPFWENAILWFVSYIPECPFYRQLHWPCPGCGNTRSVIALTRGDILGAMHFNITPIVVGVILFLLYVELVGYLFGKKIRLVSRKTYFPVLIVILMAAYYVLRNFIPALIL